MCWKSLLCWPPFCVQILLLAALRLCAQTAPPSRFEVATLKLSAPPPGDLININLGTFRGGRLTLTNVTLSDILKFSYELVSDAQLSGPGWIKDIRFDVVAEAPDNTEPAELHKMTQALLAERLHLTLRREQRVLPYLALVVAKNGPKLQLVRHLDAGPSRGPQVRGHITHPQMPLSMLAALLSRFERQTIVDRTGLAGLFQIDLEWTPDNAALPADDTAPPPERPSLFAAVQGQLGLKLEPRRGPLEVLVVEGAAKVPEEN
jgi:uncharacterized protein (TIGR03435 family)